MAAERPRKLSLFLSYAHRDGAETARRLRDDLLGSGHQVWLDAARLNGGASWSAAIEQAVDEADVVVALLSAGSYASDVCRGEVLRALRRGKRVIPLLLQPDADRPVFLEATQFISFADGRTYADGVRDLTAALGSSETAVLVKSFVRTYVTAPRLPKSIVPRPQVVASIRERLIKDDPSTTMEVVAVTGMGGVGKTILAQMLANDPVVQAAFPNGVIWVDVGRDAVEFVSRLREVGRALDDRPEHYDTIEGSRNRLRTVLQNRAVLIVLDDVWHLAQVEPFLADSPTSRLLITTRNQEIAVPLQGAAVTPGRLTDAQAVEILERWTGVPRASMPAEAGTIVRECGALPLALAMIGGMVRNGLAKARPDAWTSAARRLQDARLDAIRQPLENYRYDALDRAIAISVDDLDAEVRERYLTMGIFREDTPVPERVLAIFWQTDGDAAQRTIDGWLDASLATRDVYGRITLHDLQLDFVRRRAASLPALHGQLLDRYADHYARQWPAIVDDPYFLEFVATHMAAAERWRDLAGLLLDPRYVRAKLDVLSYPELEQDFRWADRCAAAIDDMASRSRLHEMHAQVRRLQFFVNRVKETAVFESWLHPAGTSVQRTGHLWIDGPSAVGKSAFVRHVRFRALADTTFVLLSRPIDMSRHVIDELVRQVAVTWVDAAGEPGPVGRAMSDARTPGEPGGIERRCHELNALAVELARRRAMPVCFVIDDAHRYPDESIDEVLRFRWSPEISFVWVTSGDWAPGGTIRGMILPENAKSGRISVLRLERLSDDMAASLLRRLLGTQIDDRIVQGLASYAGGNAAVLGALAARLARHDRAAITEEHVLRAIADAAAHRERPG
jgi:hypothetical protein